MSEIEIKQMQEKIDAGILLVQKRLIEKTKKEDGELVVVRDGKVFSVTDRLFAMWINKLYGKNPDF